MEIEVTTEEVRRTALATLAREVRRRARPEPKPQMLEAVKLMLRKSLRSSGDAPTFLQYWKALTLQERHESEQAS